MYLPTGGGPGGSGSLDDQLAAVRSAATELPTGTVVPVGMAVPADATVSGWPNWKIADPATCAGGLGRARGLDRGAPVARLIAGTRAEEAAAAIAAGKAVVTDPCLVSGRAATVLSDDMTGDLRKSRLPMVRRLGPARPGTRRPGSPGREPGRRQ